MAQRLYASISGLSDIYTIDISTNHGSAVSQATIECGSKTKNIGDQISIDLGYNDNHGTAFRGYIKEITKKVPNNTYVITARDDLVRAVDFFVVSTNPDTPFTRRNIAAETLVRDVLALAGLTNYDYDPTYFIYATGGSAAEVNLVSAYDYCKSIADLLTWHLYSTEYGVIKFVNRKPYPMTGSSGQPGDDYNETVLSAAYRTIDDSDILDISYRISEKDLRNRVVVYGDSGIYAEASQATSYNPETDAYETILPADYYKTAVLSTWIIGSTSQAQTTADYNLNMWNRLTDEVTLSVVGDYTLNARKIVRLNSTKINLTGDNWYVYSSEHSWSRNGYINSVILRR